MVNLKTTFSNHLNFVVLIYKSESFFNISSENMKNEVESP